MKTLYAYAYPITVTNDYNLTDEQFFAVRKIVQVFVFDRGQQTHCCEITPSYDLRFNYYSVDYEEWVTDEFRESFESDLHLYSDDIYVHCKDVERNLDSAVFLGEYPYFDEEDDDEESSLDEYDEVFERVLEHHQGNPTI